MISTEIEEFGNNRNWVFDPPHGYYAAFGEVGGIPVFTLIYGTTRIELFDAFENAVKRRLETAEEETKKNLIGCEVTLIELIYLGKWF